MNSCKVIQTHANSTKGKWLYGCGGIIRVKYAGARKRLEDGEELNTIVTSYGEKSLKTSKNRNKYMINPIQ